MYNEYAHMNIFDTKTLLFFRFTVTTRSLSTSMAHMAEWVMIPDMTHNYQCIIWQTWQNYKNMIKSPGKKTKFLHFAVGHGGARHILTRSKSDQLSKVILCFIFVQLFSNVYFQIWAVTQAIDFFQPSKEFSSCFVFFYFKLWWT